MVETKLPGSSNCIEIGTVLGAHYFTFLTTVGDGRLPYLHLYQLKMVNLDFEKQIKNVL